MRLVSYQSDSGPRAAVMQELIDGRPQLVDLNSYDPRLSTSLRELLAAGAGSLQLVEDAATNGVPLKEERAQLLAPIPDPQKVICVGLNYASHAEETGGKVGDEPVIFCKFPSTLRGHLQPIELPPVSAEVDYEAELVVVIGREAKNVSKEQAWDFIAGYCCGHDVSARDWQKGKPGRQWLLGKTFDSFAPLGPWLVTPDEVLEPGNLRIQLRLNGETMQDSCTSDLIFPIDFLISYVSQVCTLLPGDLIFTGTPPGVGMARKPPVFLQPGDEVEVDVEKLGVLKNPVVAANEV